MCQSGSKYPAQLYPGGDNYCSPLASCPEISAIIVRFLLYGRHVLTARRNCAGRGNYCRSIFVEAFLSKHFVEAFCRSIFVEALSSKHFRRSIFVEAFSSNHFRRSIFVEAFLSKHFCAKHFLCFGFTQARRTSTFKETNFAHPNFAILRAAPNHRRQTTNDSNGTRIEDQTEVFMDRSDRIGSARECAGETACGFPDQINLKSTTKHQNLQKIKEENAKTN